VLLRAEQKAQKLESFGVRTVIGSLADMERLVALASEADVVISCANADDSKATNAILSGMKKRHDATGSVPILIHTSGTGVLGDKAAGMYPTLTIFYDSDPKQIASLAPTQIHRNVDLDIVNADAQGYIKSYIVLPSTIWGIARGPLVDAGIMNPHSPPIAGLIRACVLRGQAGMVGEGKNSWSNVNIEEVADLYIVLFDAIQSGTPVGHGAEGYYFGENGEYLLYDIGQAIGVALKELGKAKTEEVSTFTTEDLDEYFGGYGFLFGANSRCRAERSRAIGWQPVKLTKDMLASIKPEVEALLPGLQNA